MNGRRIAFALVTLALATAMHLDWHFARPAHHVLSLGWTSHWLSAIPVFVLTAWYVHRAWPGRQGRASVALIGVAAVLAQVAEPLEEVLVDRASMEWAFGAPRQAAFASFTAVGILAHAATLWLLGRAPRSGDVRA
jgi:hypothetical protein